MTASQISLSNNIVKTTTTQGNEAVKAPSYASIVTGLKNKEPKGNRRGTALNLCCFQPECVNGRVIVKSPLM